MREISELEKELGNLREEDKESKLEVDIKNELAWETGFKNMGKLFNLSSEALETAEKLNYEQGKAYSYRNLAYNAVYREINMKKGVDYLLKAIEIFEKYNLLESQADCWDIYAGIFNQTGNYDSGLEYSFKSLNLYRQVDSKRGQAWAYHNLGLTFTELEDFDRAKENYEKSLSIFRDINYMSGIVRILSTLGLLLQKQEKYCEARDYFEEAMKTLTYEGTERSLLELYMGALLREAGGELDLAEEYVTRAYEGVKGEDIFMFYALIELMEINFLKENYDFIIENAEKLFKKAYEQKVNPTIYKVERVIAASYEAKGDYKNALEHYKKFYFTKEEVLSNDKRKNLKNLQLSNEIKIYEKEIEYQKKLKEETEKLLLKIFPEKIARELLDQGKVKPIYHHNVSVLFTDFVGFTKFAGNIDPEYLLEELDNCFSNFDKIIKKHGLEKLKTIGDGYMAACGIPDFDDRHAEKVVRASIEIKEFMCKLKKERMEENKPYWDIRIGINSGPLVAGVIGDDKFIYDVWGDTVNTASRMESHGLVNEVNLSADTYELIDGLFDCEYRDEIEVKGKGKLKTYWVKKVD